MQRLPLSPAPLRSARAFSRLFGSPSSTGRAKCVLTSQLCIVLRPFLPCHSTAKSSAQAVDDHGSVIALDLLDWIATMALAFIEQWNETSAGSVLVSALVAFGLFECLKALVRLLTGADRSLRFLKPKVSAGCKPSL